MIAQDRKGLGADAVWNEAFTFKNALDSTLVVQVNGCRSVRSFLCAPCIIRAGGTRETLRNFRAGIRRFCWGRRGVQCDAAAPAGGARARVRRVAEPVRGACCGRHAPCWPSSAPGLAHICTGTRPHLHCGLPRGAAAHRFPWADRSAGYSSAGEGKGYCSGVITSVGSWPCCYAVRTGGSATVLSLRETCSVPRGA